MIFIKTFVTTATYSQRPLSFDGKVHLLRFERYLDIFLRSGLVPKKTRPHPALLLLPTAFWRERSEEKSQSADSGRMPFRVYSYMLCTMWRRRRLQTQRMILSLTDDNMTGGTEICEGCCEIIYDRFVFRVGNNPWHEGCLFWYEYYLSPYQLHASDIRGLYSTICPI